jgi:hypothetical protein
MRGLTIGTRGWRVGAVVVLIGLFTAAAAHAVPTLQLDPVGGAISGAPGATIGWGFTITNSTDFIVVTSATFTGSPPGTFTDFISAFNFIVVGPSPENSSVSQTFDATTMAGIGSFAISAGAMSGTTSGQIELTYDLFSRSPNDPSFDPDTDTLATDQVLSAAASVTVVGPTDTPRVTPTATPTNTATATQTATATPTNTGIPQGGACSTPAECSTGFCADGVCCNTACNPAFGRCDLPGQRGTCSAVSPAPTLTPRALAAAAALLIGVAAFALRRRIVRH